MGSTTVTIRFDHSRYLLYWTCKESLLQMILKKVHVNYVSIICIHVLVAIVFIWYWLHCLALCNEGTYLISMTICHNALSLIFYLVRRSNHCAAPNSPYIQAYCSCIDTSLVHSLQKRQWVHTDESCTFVYCKCRTWFYVVYSGFRLKLSERNAPLPFTF